jgi:aspartate carbamoyltransferase catalytic subunit
MHRLRNVLEVRQFDRPHLDSLFARADEMRIIANAGGSNRLSGKILATLFFEPSTRTRLSFESAMTRLGGSVLTAENAIETSSWVKGETIEDTARIVESYADAIVMRHPEAGVPARAAAVIDIPVINAGDGAREHPTQALLDLYTLRQELGRLEGLHVAIVGDVLHSRVARSLIQAFELVGIHCTLVGPPALLPRDVGVEATTDIGAIRDADVVYVLRMQNERMEKGANFVPSLREYAARWGITPERLRPGQKVMHPGPMNRGVEIDPRVADSADSLVEAQVRSGLVVRMAVLYDVLTGGPVGVRALAAAEVA